MNKIAALWRNKWVKFTVVSVFYILLFVVWTGNPWMLLGLLFIYDRYISHLFYKYVWRYHKELKARSKSYKKTMEWVEAIVFAVVVTSFIRFFWFAMYVIPTPSMEKSLLVGDYLCVSKIAYGPAVPNTPIAFPLVHNTMPFSATKKSYSEWIQWPYHRLKGLGNIERGDVVVFNFPAGDTVIVERQSETYYDILRAYQIAYGPENGRKRLNSDYMIIARPVDKRENYVKRCIGLPGDTLLIEHSAVTVNGKPFGEIPNMAYRYAVQTNGTPISQTAFENMGLSPSDISYNNETRSYMLPLTADNLLKVKSMRNVTAVEKREDMWPELGVFPHAPEFYPWNGDNFGPLWIPKKGATAKLDMETLPLFADIISRYEGNKLEVRDESIYVNGTLVDSYTFQMNYYFMMGDNRHNSLDSRYWGFVPEDHIVGKASFVWLSIDQNKSFPSNIRWSRMFRKVR